MDVYVELREWKIGDPFSERMLERKGCSALFSSYAERLERMHIGNGFLTELERQLFVDILFHYEGAVAFTEEENGSLESRNRATCRNSYGSPCTLAITESQTTESHDGRDVRNYPRQSSCRELQEFTRSYCGRYFLVEKKQPRTWPLVNDIEPLSILSLFATPEYLQVSTSFLKILLNIRSHRRSTTSLAIIKSLSL
jgi:hypothetical protein